MTLELAGILVYVLVQLGIGFLVSRSVHTEEDYLLAGRSLGPVLATASLFATWFGAETCVGAAGAVYDEGLSGATIDPFGYGACLLLMGALYAAPLHRLGITTVADLFRLRFGVGVERLVVLMVVPTSVLWAAAQVRAFGTVLSVSSGLDLSVTITVAAVVAITYTAMGGLLADAVTDLVQGTALVVGLIVLGVVVLPLAGDPWAVLAAQSVERQAWGGGAQASWWATAEAWTVPICGSVLAQELIARVLGARSAVLARRAGLVAGLLYIAVGLVPVYLGLAGSLVLPGLETGEMVLPALAKAHLGPVLFVLLAGALVSAILSTVDSALLAAGGIVEHNLVGPLWPHLGERQKVGIARMGVVVAGVCAWALAQSVDSVFMLVEEASAFGSAGVFVVGTLALFTPWGGPRSATVSLVAGLLVWVGAAHLWEAELPYLMSLAAAAVGFGGVALMERRG